MVLAEASVNLRHVTATLLPFRFLLCDPIFLVLHTTIEFVLGNRALQLIGNFRQRSTKPGFLNETSADIIHRGRKRPCFHYPPVASQLLSSQSFNFALLIVCQHASTLSHHEPNRMALVDRILGRLSGVPSKPQPQPSGTLLPEPVVVAPPPPAVPNPITVPRRARRVDTATYLSHLDAPLVRLSRRDNWTIRDAVAGTHIFGGNGSGKTTGSGQTLAKAFLRAGFGGLVLCAKPDERQNWERYARACGRSKHLIIVSPDSPWRFNFIQYELRRHGDPAARVENLLSTLMNILEQTGRERGGGEDSFWQQAAELLLRNALMVLAASQSHFTLFDLQRLIDTAPSSESEAAGSVWQQTDCARHLNAARAAYEAAGRQHDFAVLQNYWIVQFPRLADRTRSSITFTLSTILQDLQIGTLHELFSTGTNFFPEDTHEGAIILLDLPAVLNRTHAVAQTLFKVVWQQAALRRMQSVGKRTRPIFLWADEAHFFVSPYDTSFQSLARATRAATVYMTQNMSAYHHRLPSRNAEAITHALLGYFQTQIFHAQSDPKTIQYAQSLFGRREVTRVNQSASWTEGTNTSQSEGRTNSSSHSFGRGDSTSSFGSSWNVNVGYGESESRTHGYTTSTTMEDVLQSHHLTALKSGTDQERGLSEAIVFRTGRVWSTGHTFLFSQFSRHIA